MPKCKYCGLDAGTHACDPKDVTINMEKQNIAILRQQVTALEARNKELVEALSITVNNISIATAGHGIKPIDIKKVLTPAWEALANQPTEGEVK